MSTLNFTPTINFCQSKLSKLEASTFWISEKFLADWVRLTEHWLINWISTVFCQSNSLSQELRQITKLQHKNGAIFLSYNSLCLFPILLEFNNYKFMWIIIYTNFEIQTAKSSNQHEVFDMVTSGFSMRYYIKWKYCQRLDPDKKFKVLRHYIFKC